MIQIKSPGRICLFGEHQDYLYYPVISMAISKYIYLKAKRIFAPKFLIDLPDVNKNLEITLNNKELEYLSKRDYLKSGYNNFLRKGFKFTKGYRITITGDIPINAGVGSSSALIIAWLYFLNLISEDKKKLDSIQLALEGYKTEVKEFNEAGGMMDHFSSVYGNLLYLELKEPIPNITYKKYNLQGFVLGDSLEKKDTVEDILKVKTVTIKAFEKLKKMMPNFNHYTTSLNEVKRYLPNLKNEYKKKIIGNIINRDITLEAKRLIFDTDEFSNPPLFYEKLGNLLNKHHEQLKNNINITTTKIDRMIENCLKNGAKGAKINGSGFGGTIFALLPQNEKSLQTAIEEMAGKAFLINVSEGVKKY
jgi:galactokinase